MIKFNLEREGFRVVGAKNGREGLNLALAERPDLILLDLMLPGMDGYEVCKVLRQEDRTRNIPIIILSARNEVVDKVVGLELGADDYLEKPFSPKELVARIKARLREKERNRAQKPLDSRLRWGELEIWPDNYIATLGGSPLNLTVKEFELLHLLVSHPNQVFSREHLLQKIWGYDSSGDTRTVDVHVSNLRHKLKEFGSKIETVRGIGYRFFQLSK